MRVFSPAHYNKKPPRPHGHWIDVLEALTWETYGHSFTWAEFRTDMQAGRRLSLEHHLLCMEPNWQALVRRFDPVDFPLRVRPVSHGGKQPDQILKFKFTVHEADLLWLMDGSGLPFDLVARMNIPSFHDRSPSQIEELHYLHLLRNGLGKPYGDYAIAPPEPDTQRKNKLVNDHHKVRRKLEYILRSNPPRSVAKATIQAALELTDTGFRKLWDKVAPDFPEWREGGAPKKSSPPK